MARGADLIRIVVRPNHPPQLLTLEPQYAAGRLKAPSRRADKGPVTTGAATSGRPESDLQAPLLFPR